MTTAEPTSDSSPASPFAVNLPKRYLIGRLFMYTSAIATFVGLVVLVVLLADVVSDGARYLSWDFLTNFPSRKPEQAGFLSAWVGSIWLLVLTASISFVVGVGSGIFLEEFAADTAIAKAIEINIGNLAAVPSIIYGLLGLQAFVRTMQAITNGRSVLAGALTMSLLILPIIIVSTREALRAVPGSLRQGGLALGATRWQVVREQILPLAMPGILTGTILALSRAIGDTASLITVGALTYIAFLPPLNPIWEGVRSPFTVMPIQIYNWVSRPQQDFHDLAATGIIILMVVLLSMNATAILVRNKLQKKLD
ncbi:phosphate ABC transporter, permease protein PstA [Rubidibacter lacunae KORDI 51-2]|uniref:Phosphate transport system permease protein PstA n=1 Tax=Rubidibacter lacunae KORDI 51-2 TaxID=582515 RepID=U5DJX8_9CHRO|nr:phosphate ABC transporter permease PstA [Rubidibacter lacunae]ERN40884.1 phosphate ABC transporter, permease protein PstA [Rubidibacter lacunae KORDI 51-2]